MKNYMYKSQSHINYKLNSWPNLNLTLTQILTLKKVPYLYVFER